MKSSFEEWNWRPAAGCTRIGAVDMHTGGEPLRILTSGLPPIPGDTVLEKRRYFRDHFDHIRTGTLWEPRGHADMYGAVVTPSRDSDFDVFFLHNEGYSTMCGHAIIALTTLVAETRLAEQDSRPNETSDIHLTFSVPAGRIRARARIVAGNVRDVTFRNVPSFVYLRNQVVDVPGIGSVQYDVAYGGAFYALVDAAHLKLDLAPRHFERLIDYGRRIKNAITSSFAIEHPFGEDLSFLYGTIFTGVAQHPGHHSRNVCIFADGELDRSPTGSGVSARAALHYARVEIELTEKIEIESILSSVMSVRVVESTRFGPYEAVIPEVGGTAYIIGRTECYFDPNDSLGRGIHTSVSCVRAADVAVCPAPGSGSRTTNVFSSQSPRYS
jgi:proline racemase